MLERRCPIAEPRADIRCAIFRIGQYVLDMTRACLLARRGRSHYRGQSAIGGSAAYSPPWRKAKDGGQPKHVAVPQEDTACRTWPRTAGWRIQSSVLEYPL